MVLSNRNAGCFHREIRGAMKEMAKEWVFNPYLIEYANIRTMSFVHFDYPKLATKRRWR